jgi:hypothetical protein
MPSVPPPEVRGVQVLQELVSSSVAGLLLLLLLMIQSLFSSCMHSTKPAGEQTTHPHESACYTHPQFVQALQSALPALLSRPTTRGRESRQLCTET